MTPRLPDGDETHYRVAERGEACEGSEGVDRVGAGYAGVDDECAVEGARI